MRKKVTLIILILALVYMLFSFLCYPGYTVENGGKEAAYTDTAALSKEIEEISKALAEIRILFILLAVSMIFYLPVFGAVSFLIIRRLRRNRIENADLLSSESKAALISASVEQPKDIDTTKGENNADMNPFAESATETEPVANARGCIFFLRNAMAAVTDKARFYIPALRKAISNIKINSCSDIDVFKDKLTNMILHKKDSAENTEDVESEKDGLDPVMIYEESGNDKIPVMHIPDEATAVTSEVTYFSAGQDEPSSDGNVSRAAQNNKNHYPRKTGRRKDKNNEKFVYSKKSRRKKRNMPISGDQATDSETCCRSNFI